MGNQIAVLAPRGAARSFDADSLLADWLADMQGKVAAGEMSPATHTTYSRGMRRFLAWVGERHLERIGPQALREWKADLARGGHKPGGVNTFYGGVRAFFHWAVAERGLAYNPCAGVPSAPRGPARHKREALGDAEVLRVLAQPDPATTEGKRDRALLYLMAYTGLRQCEVQRATLGDLRTNGRLKLAVQGKGRAEADEVVYLVQPDLVDALYTWLAVHPRGHDPAAPLFCSVGRRNYGEALALRTLRAIVKAHYRAAGVVDPRKTTHSLRHSFVSNLIRRGVSPVRIMAASRHRRLDTLLLYAHETEREGDPVEAAVDYTTGK